MEYFAGLTLAKILKTNECYGVGKSCDQVFPPSCVVHDPPEDVCRTPLTELVKATCTISPETSDGSASRSHCPPPSPEWYRASPLAAAQTSLPTLLTATNLPGKANNGGCHIPPTDLSSVPLGVTRHAADATAFLA